MPDNLFEDLTQIRSQEVPAVLQSGTRFPNPRFNPDITGSEPYLTTPTVGTAPLKFMIHPITADEINEADAMITAIPPIEFQKQPSPSGRGEVEARIGPMYDDPAYVMEKNKQLPLRDAMICLFGCTALHTTAPGATTQEKARTLAAKVPAAVLSWLANEIGDIPMISAVGEEAVTSFLARGSGNTATGSSKNTSTPSQPKKKKRSPRSKTGTTSKTSKGGPPSTGG